MGENKEGPKFIDEVREWTERMWKEFLDPNIKTRTAVTETAFNFLRQFIIEYDEMDKEIKEDDKELEQMSFKIGEAGTRLKAKDKEIEEWKTKIGDIHDILRDRKVESDDQTVNEVKGVFKQLEEERGKVKDEQELCASKSARIARLKADLKKEKEEKEAHIRSDNASEAVIKRKNKEIKDLEEKVKEIRDGIFDFYEWTVNEPEWEITYHRVRTKAAEMTHLGQSPTLPDKDKEERNWSGNVKRTVEDILSELDPMDAQFLRNCLNTKPPKESEKEEEPTNCEGCKHFSNVIQGPCLACYEQSGWEPKESVESPQLKDLDHQMDAPAGPGPPAEPKMPKSDMDIGYDLSDPDPADKGEGDQSS